MSLSLYVALEYLALNVRALVAAQEVHSVDLLVDNGKRPRHCTRSR
jgi:hypothetical protein